MNIISNIKSKIRDRRFFVIADANDNSITFSRALFRHMHIMEQQQAKVFAFFIPDSDEYGFILNPEIEQETQLAEVKYNTRYRCIGFEMLNPTVNRMFYDYGLPPSAKVKLTVQPRTSGELKYYAICKPQIK